MKFEEMTAAVAEARADLNRIDRIVDDMAHMIVGRLQKVGTYTLKRLKRELRDFNIHTGSWRD